MPDWIDDYVASTQTLPTPTIYRLWSAITAISGVMERKVWTNGSAGAIFPHLFTVFVGTPATGKSVAIRPIRDLWIKMKGLNIAPDDVTRPSLLDAISRATRMIPNSDGTALNFSSLVIPCSEFGVFFTHHDTAFLSLLNHLWDSPPIYREERRTSGVVEITKPHLVMLSATQPDYLNAFLPEEAWGMGFTSRLIMIYANEAPVTDLFAMNGYSHGAGNVVKDLETIFNLKGEFVWTKEAALEINAWHRAKCPPVPDHARLIHYNGRRTLHAIKLSMISAVSRSPELIVKVEDFERARSWLIDAEKVMPDIFLAMGQKNDSQILTDLYVHLYRTWSAVAIDKRKPLPERNIYEFLHKKVPSEKIYRLMEVAEKAGYIKRGLYPGEWLPGNRNDIQPV